MIGILVRPVVQVPLGNTVFLKCGNIVSPGKI